VRPQFAARRFAVLKRVSRIVAQLLRVVILLSSAETAARAQSSSPAGYWTLDSSSLAGSQVQDSSGNNLTGTIVGGVTSVPGKVNQALAFNGTSGQIQFATDRLTGLSNSVSLAVWIQTANASRIETIISRYSAAGSEYGYLLRTTSSGHVDLRVGGNNSTTFYPVNLTDTGKLINDGQWHHIAVVLTLGQGVSFYIDGVLSSTQALNVVAYPGASPLQLGLTGYTPYGTYFTGSMDDVRIYNRALQASEIATLVNPTNAPGLSVSPANLAFNATVGGSNPTAQSLMISNSGGGSLGAWTATASQPWLTLSIPGGSSGSSVSASGPQTISASVAVGTLSASTYSDIINISAQGASPSTQTVNVSFVVSSSAPPATGKAVGYWTFDSANIVNSQLMDSSGNNLNGTLSGSVSPTSGLFNQALNFAGTNGSVNFPADTLTDLTGNVSLTLWVKTTNATRSEALISRYSAAGAEAGYLLRTNAAGHLEARIGGSNAAQGSPATVTDTGKAINDGQWHHVALVIAVGQGVTFYIDGEPASNPAINIVSRAGGANLQFGVTGWSGYGNYFTGAMDDLRVFDRILTASEIATLYSSAGSQPPAVVAPPTISPAAGTYTTAVHVTLNPQTSGSSIYYTTNGSTPTPSSTSYAVPFTLTSTTTVKAFATAAGMTSSAVASSVFTINLSQPNPPSVSISSPTPNQQVSGTVNVTANATANTGSLTSVQIMLDGKNLGSSCASSPCTISWDTTTSTNGTHSIGATAVDSGGNQGTATSVSVTVQNTSTGTPPTVSITFVPQSVSGLVLLAASASDPVGVASVQFQIDGVSLGPAQTQSQYLFNWETGSASNGPHVITAKATDTAGRTAVSAPWTTTVNNPAPSGATVAFLGVDSTTLGNWRGVYGQDGTYVAFHYNAPPSYSTLNASNINESLYDQNSTDPRAMLKVLYSVSPNERIASYDYNRYYEDFAVTSTDNQTHRVALYFADWNLLGRTAILQAIDTASNVVLDTRIVSASNYANGSYFVYSYRGGITFHIQNNNSSATTSPNTTLSAIFWGGSGLPGGQSSGTPPSVTLSTSPSASTVSGTVQVTAGATGSSSIANLQIQLDSQNLGSPCASNACTVSWDTTKSSNGTHSLVAIATDTANNSGSSTPLSVTVANAGSTPSASNGLVGHWTLDQAAITGNSLLDSSGNNLNGTISGGVTQTTGVLNQSLSFNGSNGSVFFNSDSLTDLTGDITLALWVNTLNNSRTEALLSRYSAAGTEYGYLLRTSPTGHLELRLGGNNLAGGAATNIADTGKTINDGQYHHVAAVMSITEGVTFYIDGLPSSSSSVSLVARSGGSPLQFGLTGWFGYGTYFTGSMDDVRIYNRALSAAEILSLATSAGAQH
jgi:hypothetical protein